MRYVLEKCRVRMPLVAVEEVEAGPSEVVVAGVVPL
jgi:hypothetical protein